MSPVSDLTPDQIQDLSPYGYVPTEWASIFFLVLFGITTREYDFRLPVFIVY